MKYIVRERNSSKNIIMHSNKMLNFLYNNIFGRIILKVFITKFIANTSRLYLNSKLSKIRIKRFINNNKIDMNLYENRNYNSFNEFFIRKIKLNNRPINKNKNIFISPCDSKLTVYNITKDLEINIKDSYYSINTLVDKDIINDYIDGLLLVFRLDTTDYHRYCYIDDGSQNNNNYINGILHTVQPISLSHYNFYKTNSRCYTVLHTNNFSDVIDVEIGALMIGKIVNEHENNSFKKGEEKGHFEFGGSTICLIIKKDIVDIDKDIIENSKLNIETIVKYGEKIGSKKCIK